MNRSQLTVQQAQPTYNWNTGHGKGRQYVDIHSFPNTFRGEKAAFRFLRKLAFDSGRTCRVVRYDTPKVVSKARVSFR